MAARPKPKQQVQVFIKEWREYPKPSYPEGFTQQELGDLMGVTKTAISRYENKHRRPDLDTLKAICEALKITIEDIQHLPPPRPSKPAEPPKLTKEERRLANELLTEFIVKRRTS